MRLIDMFGLVAPEIMDKYLSKTRCVNATRITIEVFRKFNVPGRPLVTKAIAVNRAFTEKLAEEGLPPNGPGEAQRWFQENGSHSIGVGYRSPGEEVEGGYNGHLIAVVQGLVVDASAGQFSRPEHDMKFPDILVINNTTEDFLKGRENLGLLMDDGSLISYYPQIGRTDYLDLPGYQLHGDNRRIATEIVDEMRRRL